MYIVLYKARYLGEAFSNYTLLVKALPRELVKAPLRGPIWYPAHPGDLEEGLNRRGARDLDDSDATATRRRPDGLTRRKHGQSSRQRKHRPALTALWRSTR